MSRASLLGLLGVLAAAPAAAAPAAAPARTTLDVRLGGMVTSSITLHVHAADGGDADVDVGTYAAIGPGPGVVESRFVVEVHQTGLGCSNVMARLREGATDPGRVELIGREGTLQLDAVPRRFATVREAFTRLPAILRVAVPDGREPGPLHVAAVLEATECSR